MKDSVRTYLREVMVALWVLFTVSLATWWFIFSSRQAERLAQIGHDPGSEIVRHQQMLLWEGGALILSLLAGGGALGYLARREIQQGRALKEFFAAFSHELKTPLSSIRLQAQRMREKLEGDAAADKKGLERLVRESNRLALQLENALFLSSGEDRKLFLEQIRISELLTVLQESHDITIRLEGDCSLLADRRALESVFGNLLRNSFVHGGASLMEIKVLGAGRGLVTIECADNGGGYNGPPDRLGRLFFRFGRTGGNGIGLYLVKNLVSAMQGEIRFQAPRRGFSTLLRLPGKVMSDERAVAG